MHNKIKMEAKTVKDTKTNKHTGKADDIAEDALTCRHHKEQRSLSFHRHKSHPPSMHKDSMDLEKTIIELRAIESNVNNNT